MLPAAARLRRREDFALVVRRGRRAGRPTLVVHHLAPIEPAGVTQAGFVVSKAVGNSVDRHRVVRRLRHLVRPRLAMLPDGTRIVVRALPPARLASSADLAVDLDAALGRLLPEPVAAALADLVAASADRTSVVAP